MRRWVWPLVARRWRLIAGAFAGVLVSTALTLAGPALVKYAIDDGLRKGDERALELATMAFLAIAVAKPFVQRAITLLTARAGELFLADLRTTAYDRLQELSLPYFEAERAGVLVSRLTADVQSLTNFVRMALVEVLTNLLLLVATVAVLLALEPKLFAASLVSLPLIAAAWLLYHRRSHVAWTAIRETIASTLAALQERFAGVRVIQSFRREDDMFATYDVHSREQIDAWKRASYVNVSFWPVIEFSRALSMAVVLVVGVLMYERGEVSIGTIGAFVLYVMNLFDPVSRLAEWFSEMRSGQAALGKIVGVLDARVSVPEGDEARELPSAGVHTAEDVTFAYTEGRPVLEEVGVQLQAGERVALVGPTGAGKSTFAKLLARKYDPVAGAVAFGDVDLRDASLSSLRERIVFVPQEGHLFSGTIADNVRLAKPDATDEEVREALAAIGALARFERLPRGLDTDVRARGVRLSAGERQLVSLARVMLSDPAVIVLDEATSSIDPGTERAVERALAQVAEGRTVITIAHRLSTAERADRVAVLENGRLVEMGSHDELVERGSRYAQLWASWEAGTGAA